MAWGKSEEEKERERLAREAAAEQQRQADADAEQARAAEEFAMSPLGQATAAKKSGARFFQTQIPVSWLDGASNWGSSAGVVQDIGQPDLLGEIEDLGWCLEDVGYVFIETGSTSSNRVLVTGEGTVTRGVVQGIYLFRNTE